MIPWQATQQSTGSIGDQQGGLKAGSTAGPRGLWSAAESPGGGTSLVGYSRGHQWGKYCFTSSLRTYFLEQTAPSASSQVIQNWEECLLHHLVVLPFWQTSAGCRTGQRAPSWSSTRENAKSTIWEGTSPGMGTPLGLTSWKAALRTRTLGSWGTTSWPRCSNVPFIAKVAQSTRCCIWQSTACGSREVIPRLCSSTGETRPECGVQCWGPQCKRGTGLLGWVQPRAAMRIKGQEHLTEQEGLRAWQCPASAKKAPVQ